MTITYPDVMFDLSAAQAASAEWGFNCGPAAACVVLGMSPAEMRPHLLDFETRRYTNPSLMANILRGLRTTFRRTFEQAGNCCRDALRTPLYPKYGLVRVQWDGPWCDPGRPVKARYRHTHWVAVLTDESDRKAVFDANAMSVGGWLLWEEWANDLVPWLLGQAEPRASGKWWPTHCWEVDVRRE